VQGTRLERTKSGNRPALALRTKIDNDVSWFSSKGPIVYAEKVCFLLTGQVRTEAIRGSLWMVAAISRKCQ
jgi:hypothetical protein